MDTPIAEELLHKIQDLESAHARLREDLSKLLLSETLDSAAVYDAAGAGRFGSSDSRKRLSPFPFQVDSIGGDLRPLRDSPIISTSPSLKTEDSVYLNILQSMGQAIHILDLDDRFIYWNRPAENLYGYSAEEALGKSVFELIVDDEHFDMGSHIVNRVKVGECWSGLFPVRSKMGKRFSINVTDTPLYDEDGTFIGVVCLTSDSKSFEDVRYTLPDAWKSEPNISFSRARNSVSTKLGLDPEQPLQAAITSKITDLATKVSNKVRSKMRTENNIVEHEVERSDGHHFSDYESSDATRLHIKDDIGGPYEPSISGNAATSFFGTISKTGMFASKLFKESEGRASLNKITSKAEAWIGKKSKHWPWKENQQIVSEEKSHQFGWPGLHGHHTNGHSPPPIKSEFKASELNNCAVAEAQGTSSASINISSASSLSGGITSSASSSSAKNLDMDIDCSDYEIFWEDLTCKECVGQGSYGTVYHGLWCGSDVAMKVFPKVEYSENSILPFKQEVSLMKELRHPNILLFMGAVTSPHHLCIITEFLPRGSLFRLLQRDAHKLEWKRQVYMALDIARGMNYLHCCNPLIVHRDLKSANLLVDKNWTVKVADFGLSRIKHETYLTTMTGKGTPQWMAPEVLRHEPSDEKSDIYSFGVILWELATAKIPWEHLNSMQVIGAVGFMNRRLDIPTDIDPRWAAIIESCWQSEPQDRPSFGELLKTLKLLAREYARQSQAAKSGQVDDAVLKDDSQNLPEC